MTSFLPPLTMSPIVRLTIFLLLPSSFTSLLPLSLFTETSLIIGLSTKLDILCVQLFISVISYFTDSHKPSDSLVYGLLLVLNSTSPFYL